MKKPPPTLTLYEIRKQLIEKFSKKICQPEHSADYILSECLKISLPEIKINFSLQLNKKQIQKILVAGKKRARGEPLQYIFKKAYFRNLELKVGRGVLIPRPETEQILDSELEKIPYEGTVCDIGTGSGAIAISIATERRDCTVFASDISELALKYARYNRKKHNATNLRICHGNMFEPFKNQRFDAIFANLPYIKKNEIKKLPCEIRNYEPLTALDGGSDGLFFIRKLFVDAPRYAKKNALVIAEISPEQADILCKFLNSLNVYKNISVKRDLNLKARFVKAELSE